MPNSKFQDIKLTKLSKDWVSLPGLKKGMIDLLFESTFLKHCKLHHLPSNSWGRCGLSSMKVLTGILYIQQTGRLKKIKIPKVAVTKKLPNVLYWIKNLKETLLSQNIWNQTKKL